MWKAIFKVTLIWFVLALVTADEECPIRKQDCTCDFSSDAAEGGEDTKAAVGSKSEILAGAAGAMSPLLIGGAGFGIWKLIRSKGGNDSELERQDSTLSETSQVPPPYSSRRGSTK